MAVNAGAITYTVDADTAAMLKAEAVIDRSLTKITKEFDKADIAVRKFQKTQKTAGNTINSLGQVLDKNGNIVRGLTLEYRKLATESAISFNTLNTKVSKSSKAVNKAVAGMSRGAGQAGIQMQQFIGQVQGGQNALLAFSQQSADLGFVLGFPLAGAISGITASIVGLLLPSLFSSKSKMEELEKITEELGKTLKETADGADVLSERILKLAKRSEALARIEISKGINNSEDQIKKSIEAISESIKDGSFTFRKTYSATFDAIRISTSKTYEEILKSTTSFTGLLDKGLKGASLNEIGALERNTRALRKEFGLSQAQAIQLGVAVSNVFTDKSILSVKSLENVLSDLNDETVGSNKKLVKLSSALVPIFQKVFDGVDNVNLLRQAFTDLSTALATTEKEISKFDETVKGIETSLLAQKIALEDGEEAAFRFATAQQLGLKVGEQIPANLDEQIAALFRLKKEMKDVETSRKILSKSSRVGDIGLTSLQSLEKRFEIEQGLLDDAVDSKLMTEANFLERSKVLRENFISDIESIEKGSAAKFALIGLSEDEVLIERFNRQNEILKQAREKDLLTEIDFISRKENLQSQHEESLKKLREKSTSDAIINFEALENQVIGTFASIASGAQDGKDAIKSLAQSILTQMIGALIKMGIQAIIGQTTATAASVASAATIATAAAPAAALMSLATAGANAAPAAIGISSTVALAQGLAIPGLEHGGNARAGGLFQVGEGGKPEIFTSGGKNFMIPGDSGNVISNKDAFGGQQVQMNVTIENNVSNAGIKTQMSDDGKNLKIMVNEVANQINTGQGVISRALRNSTNLTFRANR